MHRSSFREPSESALLPGLLSVEIKLPHLDICWNFPAKPFSNHSIHSSEDIGIFAILCPVTRSTAAQILCPAMTFPDS